MQIEPRLIHEMHARPQINNQYRSTRSKYTQKKDKSATEINLEAISADSVTWIEWLHRKVADSIKNQRLMTQLRKLNCPSGRNRPVQLTFRK